MDKKTERRKQWWSVTHRVVVAAVPATSHCSGAAAAFEWSSSVMRLRAEAPTVSAEMNHTESRAVACAARRLGRHPAGFCRQLRVGDGDGHIVAARPYRGCHNPTNRDSQRLDRDGIVPAPVSMRLESRHISAQCMRPLSSQNSQVQCGHHLLVTSSACRAFLCSLGSQSSRRSVRTRVPGPDPCGHHTALTFASCSTASGFSPGSLPAPPVS